MTMTEPENVADMSIRQINRYFREHDESRKYPICGRFNATERAIRRVRRLRREGLEVYPGLEYYLTLERELTEIVNAA